MYFNFLPKVIFLADPFEEDLETHLEKPVINLVGLTLEIYSRNALGDLRLVHFLSAFLSEFKTSQNENEKSHFNQNGIGKEKF